MDKAIAIRAAYAIILLLILYSIGLPLHYVLLMGVLMIVFLALRGPIYKKIEQFIEKIAPSTVKWPQWGRKALVIVAFIAVFVILKQIIYWLLGIAGFDLQGEMVAAMQPKP